MFCKEIQSAIEAGRIKFDVPEKPMKIDGHLFPVNIVHAKDQDAKTGPKMLASERAKRLCAVEPKSQVSANQLGGMANMRKERILEDPADV